jgi:hypothetical protein
MAGGGAEPQRWHGCRVKAAGPASRRTPPYGQVTWAFKGRVGVEGNKGLPGTILGDTDWTLVHQSESDSRSRDPHESDTGHVTCPSLPPHGHVTNLESGHVAVTWRIRIFRPGSGPTRGHMTRGHVARQGCGPQGQAIGVGREPGKPGGKTGGGACAASDKRTGRSRRAWAGWMDSDGAGTGRVQ